MSYTATLMHHWDVLRIAWEERRAAERAGGSWAEARRGELAFLPAALEVTETPAPALGRAMALSISGFFVIAIGWASFGEMDIIATAQGKIIPSQRVKTIQPMEVAVVRAIHVRDGSIVKAGDVLIELDPTGSEADRERLAQDLVSSKTELARLSALLAVDPEKAFAPPRGAPDDLIKLHRSYLLSQFNQRRAERSARLNEISRRKAAIQTIIAEIARLERKLSQVRERVAGNRTLFEQGIVAKLRFNEQEEELFDVEGQLEVELRRLTEAEAALSVAQSEARQGQAAWRRDILAQKTETRQRVIDLDQELKKATERNRQRTLTAPVDGTVQQLAVHTVGGVVTEAQPLMQIVPAAAEIEIEALVLNKDIGFVNAEQEAEIKVESFPFTKYGTIDGTVRHVYGDAVEDERNGLAYPARVTMAATTILVRNKQVRLSPGMAVTVEIKTGKRRIIDYILAPLQEYQDESLREQ